jgi:hypothetical protein
MDRDSLSERDYLIIAGWIVMLTIGCRYISEIWLPLKGAGIWVDFKVHELIGSLHISS